MQKEAIFTDEAPKPVGPYNQAIVYNDLIFISGQIPIDPKTGEIVNGDFAEKSRQVLNNLKAILEAAGGSIDTLVKVTVYLRDISKFSEFNKIYSEFIGKSVAPARVVIEVSNLPLNVDIEIEAIAFKLK